MLDGASFDSILDEETRDAAKRSLGFLAKIGVFQTQIDLEWSKVMNGRVDQAPEQLANQILEYRRVEQTLRTLEQLGLFYQKELG